MHERLLQAGPRPAGARAGERSPAQRPPIIHRAPVDHPVDADDAGWGWHRRGRRCGGRRRGGGTQPSLQYPSVNLRGFVVGLSFLQPVYYLVLPGGGRQPPGTSFFSFFFRGGVVATQSLAPEATAVASRSLWNIRASGVIKPRLAVIVEDESLRLG